MLTTFDLAVEPEPAHRLDEGALLAYLKQHIRGFRNDGSFTVRQFAHGQSNPTYLIQAGGHKYVLRKKPPGRVLTSAHAVDREHRIVSALSGTQVPVPQALCLCTDASVVGTPFYVMSFVGGRVYTDPALPELPPAQRSAVYGAFARTLARLHVVDPAAVGLQSYGPASGYCRRQVKRWAAQYKASVLPGQQPLPEVLQLIAWLQDHIPAHDAYPATTRISHGDFRLDNLVFDSSDPHAVLALLDWELSTLGDPLADLAYACLPYHLPNAIPSLPSLPSPLPPGVPSELEFVAAYAAERGMQPPPLASLAFHLALSMFRIAAILAGVGARAAQGNASSRIASQVGAVEVVSGIATRALSIIADAGAAAAPSDHQHSSPGSSANAEAALQRVGCSAAANSSATAVHSAESEHSSPAAGPTHGLASSSGAAASGSPAPNSSMPPADAAASCRLGSVSRHLTSAAAAADSTAASSAKFGSSLASLASASMAATTAAAQGRPAAGESSPTGFGPSSKAAALVQQLRRFLAQHVEPAEHTLEAFHSDRRNRDRWQLHPLREQLRRRAQEAGLWNLWIPATLAAAMQPLQEAEGGTLQLGAGLSNLEYAHLCEPMGRIPWAPEIFNCNAPDTGNMEVLAKYGTLEQQKRWLAPLLRGDISSCFAMTEPGVASSDATNIRGSITRICSGDEWELHGDKWWTTGACSPTCQLAIFMGKTDTAAAPHKQQSMVLAPMSTPGVSVLRPLEVFGYDAAPHGHAEVRFDRVRVPAGNLLLGEGRGFEIAQGRLGPGRLHHCMRIIGLGERAMELMASRAHSRVAFGRPIAEQGAFRKELAGHRIQLDAARLTVLSAADALDKIGNKAARNQINAAKVLAPSVVLAILDAAIQVHGAAGVSADTPLAALYAEARTLRIADGPDDVHLAAIAKSELRRSATPTAKL